MVSIDMDSLTLRERIHNGLVFACLSLALVMPGGPKLLALCLAGMGLWSCQDLRTDLAQVWGRPAVRIMTLGVAIFVGVGIFLGIWYDYRPGHYEAFIPFFLAPLMLHGVLKARLQPVVLWTGSATAAVLAGLYASYQSLVLLTGRAMGAMSNPIIFGDLSVVLACIALFGLLYFEQAKNHLWMRVYLSFGAAMGVWGSLLSGSKGGWLSIIMVLLVFVWRVTAGQPLIWRFLGVVLISVLVAKGVWLAPRPHARHWMRHCGGPPKAPQRFSGVVLTGSHHMVSEREPWSEALVPWLQAAVEAGTPLLGICYGHQLLAHALGGEVAHHPEGVEIGTVTVELQDSAVGDPLLGGLPETFPAQAVHWQSVRRLPPGAVLLAGSAHESHHAFRIGDRAWGVQFHPEFSDAALRAYLDGLGDLLADEGLDAAAIAARLQPTPEAASVLPRFARLALSA